MWTIWKIFIEFITILLLFYVLVFWPWGMWDLSAQTRTRTACIGRCSLNHWTAREVPSDLSRAFPFSPVDWDLEILYLCNLFPLTVAQSMRKNSSHLSLPWEGYYCCALLLWARLSYYGEQGLCSSICMLVLFFLSSLPERLLQPTSTWARSKLNTLHGLWAQTTWAPVKSCSQMVV